MGLQIRASLLFLATLSLIASCGDESGGPAPTENDLGLGTSGPRIPADLVQEALGFLELGNGPRARDLLLEALSIDDGLAEAHHYLGRALMGMARVDASHAGAGGSVGLSQDTEIQKQGVASLRRAAELSPQDADYFYWLGRALHRSGHNPEAVLALAQATALDPQHGMAHKRLGITHLDAGDPELALPSFLAAEKLLPEDPGPAFQVGNLLSEDDPEGAHAAFQRSIAVDRSFPAPYNGLITILNRLGDAEGSAEAAANFARWNDFEARMQGLLGRAQRLTADLDAQLDVADAMLEKEDWDGARDYFIRSILLDSSNDYAHYNLGILNHKLGDHATALMHLEETLHLKPTAFEPRLLLISVCQALNNEERLAELLALFERDVEKLDEAAHLRLAITLHEAGLKLEAEKHYRLLLVKHPSNATAQDGLKTLMASGDSK